MSKLQIDRRRFVFGVAGLSLAGALPRLAAAAEPPGWLPMPPLPLRLQEIYPAVVSGRIVVAGGLSPDVPGAISDRVVSWTPGESDWTEHTVLPVPAHHLNCIGHEGKLWAIGGFVAEDDDVWRPTPSVRVLNVATGAWAEGPSLPAGQAETVLAAVDGRLHLIGGRRAKDADGAAYGDAMDVGDHLVLDRGQWSAAAPLPMPRNSAACGVLGSRIHVVGGRTMAGGNSDRHEAYDPSADQWQTLEPLPPTDGTPPGAGGLAAAALGERLYAFGGEWFERGSGVYRAVWSFGADGWRSEGEMQTPRHGLGAVTLENAIYTIGGAKRAGMTETSTTVERFTPA